VVKIRERRVRKTISTDSYAAFTKTKLSANKEKLAIKLVCYFPRIYFKNCTRPAKIENLLP
jgi:hypothetical protein